MKRRLFVFISILLSAIFTLGAQDIKNIEKPYIEVTGSAEMEIDPDEIYLSIIIGGYNVIKNDKDIVDSNDDQKWVIEQKIDVEQVDKNLKRILINANIAGKDIILQNVSSLTPYSYNPRRYVNIESLQREYHIKLYSPTQLDELLPKLGSPKEGFFSINVREMKNTKISEYREQTKIDALKAAQIKARKLVEAIGSRLGKPIYIIEQNNDNNYLLPYAASNVSNMQATSGNGGEGENNSMRKIKIRYEMKARFEIAE